MSELNVSICDGKYTIIQKPTGKTRVLRYGEEWDDVTGDNVICGLAWELQESRERIKRLEEALESIREYWNRDNNNQALVDACWYAIDKAAEALKAKEAKL
jgi:hypothetical protein